MIKTPVVILAYNRPQYLNKCLDSIKKQMDGRSIHLFIDGPRNHDDHVLIQQSVSLARQKIFNIEIHPSPQHVSAHLLNKRARDFIFEVNDRAVFVSENIELNDYYLDQLDDLYNKSKESGKNIGIVSCLSGKNISQNCQESSGEISELSFFPTTLAYLMTRDCYDKIYDDMDEYYSIVQDYYRADIHSLRSKFEVGNRFDGSVQQMTILAMSRNESLFLTTTCNHGKILDFPDIPCVYKRVTEFDIDKINEKEHLEETVRYFQESKDYREFLVQVF